ncbi:hypothetical protein J7T55_009893 [Diaporthe amygdali]|uniref:uncharacterized protein n=1 Tax=Phomopsis amygdali TaxID=1214568 RepID=UPI0022FDEF4D|nr:uncharacterized protein J7T55_009893 [Diaporthe amygdali]KAJ0116743.1 hypothetical protein J7T55_009893 [Diaporthe amygdali]
MSEYNNLFDFSAYDSGLLAFGPDQLGPSPSLDHSQARTAPFELSIGLTEGDIAAQLQTYSALHQHAKQAEHQAYKCKCGTGFNKHSALDRHIKTKDAPKNFACTLCYEKFNRKDKLHDHCRHYHKVTDEGLRALFNIQEARPRAAANRRRRGPVPLAAASSGSAPPPTPAPISVSAGLSAWGPDVNAGQRFANLPARHFISAEPFLPAGPPVPAANPFTSAPVTDEDFADLANEIFGDGTWATNFDDLTF